MEQPIVVEWEGNKITLTFEGKGAEMVYYDYFMRQVEKVRRDLAKRNGICCAELKAALGKHDRYPRLAYISEGTWDDGRLRWQHHGATGPGYYQVYDLVTREGIEEEMTTYVALFACPFCHARLEGVGAGEKKS